MSDYNVTFAGLPLESPIIIETGADRLELPVVKRCIDAGAGGILFPTLTEERIRRVIDEDELTEHNRTDRGSRDSERVLRRLNIEEHLERLETTARESSVPVIASLQCDRRNQWFALAQQMKDAGAAAIEIVPYRDEAFRSRRSDHVEKTILRVTSYLADRLEAPLVVRIPSFVHGTQTFVHALGDAGAAGILLEPPPGFAGVDVESVSLTQPERDKTVAHGAFLSLFSVCRTLYRRVGSHIAIQLPDGSPSSLVTAILGGASLVTLPVPGDDPDEAGQSIRRHIAYLKKWMSAHQANSLFDVRGSLSESRLSSSLEN
ncbi:MAG: hypothetical protein ACLFR8_01755 [Alkalispirochaeta sp.]